MLNIKRLIKWFVAVIMLNMKFNPFSWFKRGSGKEANVLRKAIENGAFDIAYKNRIKDIESLRKYDRGEKEIIAPDIKNIMRTLRESRS